MPFYLKKIARKTTHSEEVIGREAFCHQTQNLVPSGCLLDNRLFIFLLILL